MICCALSSFPCNWEGFLVVVVWACFSCSFAGQVSFDILTVRMFLTSLNKKKRKRLAPTRYMTGHQTLTVRKCCWSASGWRLAVPGTFHKSDAGWSLENPSLLGPHCQRAPAAERTDKKHIISVFSPFNRAIRWISNTKISFIFRFLHTVEFIVLPDHFWLFECYFLQERCWKTASASYPVLTAGLAHHVVFVYCKERCGSSWF